MGGGGGGTRRTWRKEGKGKADSHSSEGPHQREHPGVPSYFPSPLSLSPDGFKMSCLPPFGSLAQLQAPVGSCCVSAAHSSRPASPSRCLDTKPQKLRSGVTAQLQRGTGGSFQTSTLYFPRNIRGWKYGEFKRASVSLDSWALGRAVELGYVFIAASASGGSGPEWVGPWIRMVPAPWRTASPGTRREVPECES